MKNFEKPEIIDTFESTEGVYLASGGTHDNPPPDDKKSLWYEFSAYSHDGGSHTDCSFDVHFTKGSYILNLLFTLRDFSVTIKSVTIDTHASSDRVTYYKITNQTEHSFNLEMTFYTPNEGGPENCQFYIPIVFGGSSNGSYKHREGSEHDKYREANEIFSITPV